MTVKEFCDGGGAFIIYSAQVPTHIRISHERRGLWVTSWKKPRPPVRHQTFDQALRYAVQQLVTEFEKGMTNV